MAKHQIRGLALVAASVSALAVAVAPAAVIANNANNQATQHQSNSEMYTAHLRQLNDSGVHGTAHLNYQNGGQAGSETLSVDLSAHNTEANQTHPVHIHGKENPEVAFCPTNEVDANGDGFISVIEGAATYGPIKLNLTSPQTPFGTPPTPALFTPFAGTADPANFPVANNGGSIHQSETYRFDQSAEARGALGTLMPLDDQHIVVHGAHAPASVDADAFAALGLPVSVDPNAEIYDVLLPIACGEINRVDEHGQVQSNQNNNNNNQQGQQNQNGGQGASVDQQAAVAGFHDKIAKLTQEYEAAHQAAAATFESDRQNNHGAARDNFVATIQAARDHKVSKFYEARNYFVHEMNQTGNVQLRDETTRQAEHELEQFSQKFEQSKHEFLSAHN